jgi:hypothetical protein
MTHVFLEPSLSACLRPQGRLFEERGHAPLKEFQEDADGMRGLCGSLNANIEDGASVQHSLQRPFVRIAMARLRDTKKRTRRQP